jgi:hypothetical protein
MIRRRIAGTAGALALLTAPAVAVAHGDHGDHGGKRHGPKGDVTGRASATVASFTAGELTLTLPSGRTLTASVTARTVLICHPLPSTTTPASTSVPASTAVAARGKRHGHGHGADGRCGADRLVAGAKVSEAKLSLKADTVIWKKIVIVS